MKRSIAYPWRVHGANFYRSSFNRWATAKQAKEARGLATLMLSQLPRMPNAPGNRFRVTLTRIAASYLDEDNVEGGDFKHIRDAVAAWLGLDDRDARISFDYLQQAAPRGTWAARIEIEDDTPGEDYHRIMSGVPERLGVAKARVCRGDRNDAPKPVEPREQRELRARACFALLPWEQDGGEPVATELAIDGLRAPPRISIRVPVSTLSGAGTVRYAIGQSIELARSEAEIDGQTVWLYAERRRAEAVHEHTR